MVRFGTDKIEEVRARADIVEIVGAQVRLKRAGRNFVGLCPFHNEKTPSFSVNAERGFFHCFGCGAGGTVFDFVMKVEGLTFFEALQSLARRYGIVLPEHTGPGGPPPGERDALALANLTAAEFFAHVLWKTADGAPARDYLKARGITEETAHAFILGYAPARPANLATVIGKRGMLEAAVKAGLVKREPGRDPYDMFRARLMFPIRDAQGRVIGFGGRVLDQRLPKYINSPESPIYSKARGLYGVFEARQAIAQADRAIVVEGYIDVIALWQAGFKETVASLGTSLTVDQLRLLARYTRNIVACFDGDAAGRKASLRALEVFLGAGLLGRGVFIPSGFDPDTLVRDRGAQALNELIESSELLVDYFLREQAAAAGATLSGKARAAERVAEILRMVANPFEFDLLARKAADSLGVGEELLRREARKGGANNMPLRRTSGAAPARPARTAARGDAVAQAEIGLIAIALDYSEMRAEIAAQLPSIEFNDPMLGAMLEDICLSDEARATLEVRILAGLSEDQRERLSALMVGPLMVNAEGAQRMAADFISALARSRQRREVESLRRVAADTSGDDAEAAAQAVIALRRQTHDGN
ncbi:MAG: DNA primase [Candidatus Binataceae bacterium]|jgi:DNA primase